MDKNNRIEKKRKQEIEMLDCMIRIYCRGNHGTKEKLCEDCQALREYAVTRTQKCPFMETKTFCSACKVHCYSPQMQQRVKAAYVICASGNGFEACEGDFGREEKEQQKRNVKEGYD